MRFLLAFLGGAVAAFLAAIIWAAITDATSFQIGFMSVGVGFAVAFAVRFCGGGHDKNLAILSAVLSLAGCLLGNYLAATTLAAQHAHVSPLASAIDFLPIFPRVIGDTFNAMDILFYGMGIYFGYKYALIPLRQPPPEPQASASA